MSRDMEIEVALTIIKNLEKNLTRPNTPDEIKLKFLKMRDEVERHFIFKTSEL